MFKHWPCKSLREKALCTVMQHIHYEDENTRYICIGPVNKVCLENGCTILRFDLEESSLFTLNCNLEGEGICRLLSHFTNSRVLL